MRKKRKSVHEKAYAALRHAYRDLVRERKKSGQSVIIWKDGKVRRVSAKNL